jgi:hypothetical protein
MPDQANLIIETNGIQFGVSGSSTSVTLKLDQSVIGTTGLAITASVPFGSPFSVAVTNSNTPNPTITLTMTAIPLLGQPYYVNLVSGSNTDTLNVLFLFSENYQVIDWPNSNLEDNISGYFKLTQIAQGAQLLSATLNTKLRSIIQFISLTNTKITNFMQVYRIKKNLPDIINSAIFAGSVPAGYTGTVTYGDDVTVPASAIASIILQDTAADSDSYTKITFNYSTQSKIITFTDTSTTPSTITPTTSNYLALSGISVDRINSSLATQYNIATVTVLREASPSAIVSLIDPNYTITMARINGWTVAG